MLETGRWLWRWFEKIAQGPYGLPFLFIYAFVETLVTLLPIDPFVIAVMLADRKRTGYIATVITIGSLFGAVVGYWIGDEVFAYFGHFLLGSSAGEHLFNHVRTIFAANSFLITFTTALVPIPKTPTILAAGFLHTDILTFAIAWVVGRALHFYGEAFIVRFGTHETMSYSFKVLTIVSVIVALAVVGWLAYAFSGI